MTRGLKTVTRAWLLRQRVLPVPEGYALDPQSPDYLYLVQQRKRLSLSTSIGRLRPGNLPLLPVIGVIVLFKTVDLWITNQLIRSLLNEQDLLQRSNSTREPRD